MIWIRAWRDRIAGHGIEGLEVSLGLLALFCILPNTWLTALLTDLGLKGLISLGCAFDRGWMLSYFAGGILMACLLFRYVGERRFNRAFPVSLANFTDAVCLFSLLFLLDFFLSTADPYHFDISVWPFLLLAPFFLMLLFLNRRQTFRLVRLLALLSGMQAVFAIVYYAFGWHQFLTPHFGNRTGGTFYDPNALYPLCLLGGTLSLALSGVQSRNWQRYLFLAAGLANLLALLFTYMRSGWLALGAALIYLFYVRPLPLLKKPFAKTLGVLSLIALITGTLFFRTHGGLVGNPHDRSTLGRFQIWQVSMRAIAHHPLLGSGFATYEATQTQHMTPALQAFNPMNSDAKSLFLNVAAEFGVVGLSMLALTGVRYVQCYRRTLALVEAGSEAAAILVGTMAGTIAIAVAGLTDTPILQQFRNPGTCALALLLGASAVVARETLPAPEATCRPLEQGNRRLRLLLSATLVGSVLLGLGWLIGSTILLVRTALPKVDTKVARLNADEVSSTTEAISQSMRDALVTAEDSNYYEHHGVDWEAMHRAMRKDIRAMRMVQGGSTITMQTARYLFLSEQKNLPRKCAELYLASYLERHLTKRQILELYLSNVNFGMHTPGVARAAHTFFGKSPSALTLGEVAFLAGNLPKPPERQEDVMARALEVRRRNVLIRMQAYYPNVYSASNVETALNEKLIFAWQKQAGRR